MNPIGLNPVASPVSSSRRAYRSRVYLRISVDVSEVDPNVTIRPAACHVVPDVNRSRSSRTTSAQPSLARWYATEVPMIPPPIRSEERRVGKAWSIRLETVTLDDNRLEAFTDNP